MVKKKKKQKAQIGFIVRVTTHRHLRGKHLDRKHRTIRKRKEWERVSYQPFEEIKKRKVRHRIYVTEYHEGDVVRTTKVFYLRNDADITQFLFHFAKKFKKSKQTNFSATSQIYKGRISNRQKGRVSQDTVISRAAKIYAKTKEKSLTYLNNQARQLHRDVLKILEEYIERKWKRKYK